MSDALDRFIRKCKSGCITVLPADDPLAPSARVFHHDRIREHYGPAVADAVRQAIGVVVKWELPGVFAGTPGNVLTLVQDAIAAGGHGPKTHKLRIGPVSP